MTEAEWRTEIEDKLKLFRSRKVRRKLRLFACACCRRAWPYLPAQSQQVVEVAERCAEGTASKSELGELWKRDKLTVRCNSVCAPITVAAVLAPQEACHTIEAYTGPRGGIYVTDEHRAIRAAEYRDQIELLRDIFGTPFCPVPFATEWRTDTAVALARQMYESRDFSAMPILADALQDAGCDNEDILNHCRQPGEHVRGCWVVDLLLGKS
jgi:hypothetical protein